MFRLHNAFLPSLLAPFSALVNNILLFNLFEISGLLHASILLMHTYQGQSRTQINASARARDGVGFGKIGNPNPSNTDV